MATKRDYSSRKFLLTIGLVLLSTSMLVLSFIGEASWKEVIMAVFSIFMMGHVGEKLGHKFIDKNNNGIPDDQEELEAPKKEKQKKKDKDPLEEGNEDL